VNESAAFLANDLKPAISSDFRCMVR